MGAVWAGFLVGALVSGQASADSWSRLGSELNGQAVRTLAADPNDPLRLAAIAGNQLYTTVTGGITWEKTDLGVFLNQVAYDPDSPGRLIVGTTGKCLMIRDTPVAAWQSFGAAMPDCSVGSMAVAGGQVFFVNEGAATRDILRLDRGGVLVKTNYGDRPRAFGLTADPDGHHLYVSSDLDLFRSDDSGATWQTLPKPEGPYRCCIGGMWAAGETIWQLAYGRPEVSYDSGITWVGRGPKSDYHYYQTALTVSGATPYFGMRDDGIGLPDVVTTATVPMVGLGLGRMPTKIIAADNRLIVATGDGIWVDDVALPSPAQLKRPVIVIPGIMGSWPKQFGLVGELVLDPLAHTYDRLVDRLRAVGFSEDNHTLRLFPYQWRQDNQLTAQQLADTITRTKLDCGCPKVDLVAHSMGGLVARSYIEGDGYRGDVGKLIEIATPNRGSPEAYYMWEGGEFYNDNTVASYLQNAVIQAVMRIEAALKHYLSFIDYLRLRVPSVGQLLPDYSYLTERIYPIGHPRNTYLEDLNTTEGVARLKQRVQLYVTGSKALPTLTGLRVGPASGDHAWPDGRITERMFGLGDGTVPYPSLSALERVNWLTAADHGTLVGDSARAVIKYLLDGDPDGAYLASIPNQAELQRIADAPAPNLPQREAVVYAPESSNLTVRDTAGHVADGSVQTFPGAYWFTDGDGRYLIIPNPAPDQAIGVTVTSFEAVPVGVIDLAAGVPEQSSEVMIGGVAPGNSATIVLGDSGGPATRIFLASTTPAKPQVQVQSTAASVAILSGDVLSQAQIRLQSLVQLPAHPVPAGRSPVTMKSPKAKHAPGFLGLLCLSSLLFLVLLLIIWLLLRRARSRAADRT